MKIKLSNVQGDLDSIAWEIGHEIDIPSKALARFVLDLIAFDDNAPNIIYKQLQKREK